MPAVTETFSLGTPVEINRIQKELKKLWAEGEGVMTRASLINLAVYSEEQDSLGKNTQLMSQLTESHACRAIVIEADRSATQNQVAAWIVVNIIAITAAAVMANSIDAEPRSPSGRPRRARRRRGWGAAVLIGFRAAGYSQRR